MFVYIFLLMRRYFFIYILIALFCSNFIVSPLYAGEIRLVGSSTVALAIKGALESFSEENPDIKVKLDVSNSGRGVRALSDGKVDIAMISTPVQVLKFRIAHIDWDRLNALKIAERKIVFITHKDNPVTHLTQPQIYNILSGRAKNWRAFGGDDDIFWLSVNMHRAEYAQQLKTLCLKGNILTPNWRA
ncbi:MAG: hypothetical protein CL561_05700 [Alphaproteobacteria bacterium]|nr:hypothetical protein [Alphaproteobacteria bacterium]